MGFSKADSSPDFTLGDMLAAIKAKAAPRHVHVNDEDGSTILDDLMLNVKFQKR